MSMSNSGIPKLFAFDLDGTLLDSKKQLSQNTINALHEIHSFGSVVAFASGRIQSSMLKYLDLCNFPIAVLSLNGAIVQMDSTHNFKKVYSSSLSSEHADFILDHAAQQQITLNYYYDDMLFTIQNSKNEPWINLYTDQTGSKYHFINSFDQFKGLSPSKIIMLGSPEELDREQDFFRNLWGNEVYVCRTWDYYLEFLHPTANKGCGLYSLANAYSIDMKDVIAFGDAENDIPMLQKAGTGIAVNNASDLVKKSANRVSCWTNDEDAVAKEWNQIKKAALNIAS